MADGRAEGRVDGWADGWRLFWRTVGVFTYRDLAIQYRTLYRGLAWFLVQQALYVVLFAVFLEGIFGRGRPVEAGAAPYWLYVYSGIVIWQFFAKAISRAMTSLTDQRAILSRVRVSIPAIPVAAVAACTVELAVSLVMLAIAIAVTGSGHATAGGLALGAVALVLFLVCTAAIGMLLAVANVWVEELRQVFPVLLQLWFFLTPVVYFADAAPEGLRWVFEANPVAIYLTDLRILLQEDQKFNTTNFNTILILTAIFFIFGIVSGKNLNNLSDRI